VVTRANAAFARLCHPTRYGVYYNKDDAVNPWVEHGYTRWTIMEWEGLFGAAFDQAGSDPTHDPERKWEFFGYTIPLYNDPKT
jgi:hypothetical protein